MKKFYWMLIVAFCMHFWNLSYVKADFFPQYKGNSWEFAIGSAVSSRESGYQDDDGKQFSFDTPATLAVSGSGMYKTRYGALRIFGEIPTMKLEDDPGTQWNAGLSLRLGGHKWRGSVENVFSYRSGIAGTIQSAFLFSDLGVSTSLRLHYQWTKFFNSWFGYKQNIYKTPLAQSMVSGKRETPVIFTEIFESARVFDITGGGGVEFETRYHDWYFKLHAGIFLGAGALDWPTQKETNVHAAFIADFSGEAGVGYQLYSSGMSKGLLWIGDTVNVHYLSGGQGDLTRNGDGGVETFHPGHMVNWLDIAHVFGLWLVFTI